MKRKLVFSEEAWKDYLHWQETDRSMVRRINQLIKDVRRSPYEGIGKPDAAEASTGRMVVAAD